MRLNRRFETAAVQGEGSFIAFRSLTIGERREVIAELRSVDANDKGAVDAEAQKILNEWFAEWNWADSAGNPMPPLPEVPWDRLTLDEVELLTGLILDVFDIQIRQAGDKATKGPSTKN